MDLAELLAKREQTEDGILEVERADEVPGRSHPLLNPRRTPREADDVYSGTGWPLAGTAEGHEPDTARQTWRHRCARLSMLEDAARGIHHLVVWAATEPANGEGDRGHPAQAGIQLGRSLFTSPMMTSIPSSCAPRAGSTPR